MLLCPWIWCFALMLCFKCQVLKVLCTAPAKIGSIRCGNIWQNKLICDKICVTSSLLEFMWGGSSWDLLNKLWTCVSRQTIARFFHPWSSGQNVKHSPWIRVNISNVRSNFAKQTVFNHMEHIVKDFRRRDKCELFSMKYAAYSNIIMDWLSTFGLVMLFILSWYYSGGLMKVRLSGWWQWQEENMQRCRYAHLWIATHFTAYSVHVA